MTVPQEKFKVLLIGDACWDYYIFVEQIRDNPENEAPLLTEINRLMSGGMGKNVLKCLSNLKIEVVSLFSQALSEKVRVIDNETGYNYFRLDKDVDPSYLDLNKILHNIHYDAVVISDYNKGFIDTHTIKFIQNNFHCPIFLDTKKKNLQDFDKCIIKINSYEASIADMVPKNTIITEGKLGAYTEDFRVPGMRVDCVDVCGAGDAFLAGLVYGYLLNKDINKGIMYGVVNSGISVTKYGTYAPSLIDLQSGLKEYVKYCGEN